MSDLFLDTHSLLWHLADDSRLSAGARSVIDAAMSSQGTLFFSAITLAEVIYLEEKRRLAPGSFAALRVALSSSSGGIRDVALDMGVVIAMQSIPRSAVPDLPDRIISASALLLGLPLVTGDGRIRSPSNLKTIC